MAYYDPKTRPENLPPRAPRVEKPSKWRPDWVKPPGQWLEWPTYPKTFEGWAAWLIERVILVAVLYWFTVEVEPWLRHAAPWIWSR